MTLNDTLSNALSHIYNSEKVGKKKVEVAKSSKVIASVLEILKQNNYIEDFKVIKTNQGDKIEINLNGKINKCGSVKPRFPVEVSEIRKFEKRYLPARDFGILIVSTSKGMMTHYSAVEKNLGGKLIAYCY